MLVRQNQYALQILNYPVLALFKSDIYATLNLSFKTVAYIIQAVVFNLSVT